MRMTLAALTGAALIGFGASAGEAQAVAVPLRVNSSNSADIGRVLNRDHRENDREDARRDARCSVDRREIDRQRTDLHRRVRAQHEQWHRAHGNRNERNWQREHEALHDRLERQVQNWERNVRQDCDNRREDRYDDDNDRRDQDRRYNNTGSSDDRFEEKRRDKQDKLDDKLQRKLDDNRRKSERGERERD